MTKSQGGNFSNVQQDCNEIFVVIKEGKPEHAFSSKEKAVSYACGGKLTDEQIRKLDSGEALTEFNGREIVACPLN